MMIKNLNPEELTDRLKRIEGDDRGGALVDSLLGVAIGA